MLINQGLNTDIEIHTHRSIFSFSIYSAFIHRTPNDAHVHYLYGAKSWAWAPGSYKWKLPSRILDSKGRRSRVLQVHKENPYGVLGECEEGEVCQLETASVSGIYLRGADPLPCGRRGVPLSPGKLAFPADSNRLPGQLLDKVLCKLLAILFAASQDTATDNTAMQSQRLQILKTKPPDIIQLNTSASFFFHLNWKWT